MKKLLANENFLLASALLLLIITSAGCGKDCHDKVTNKVIKPEVANYLQITKGNVRKYAHYLQGSCFDTVVFIADSPFFRTDKNYLQPEAKCKTIEQIERKRYQFRKATDISTIAYFEIEGNYSPGLYDGDWDHTKLDVFFNDIHFSFFDFGSAVVSGKLSGGEISYYQTDSIISLNRNYGSGWVLQGPGLKSKIYFNRSHGIIKYENSGDDEQYYLCDQ